MSFSSVADEMTRVISALTQWHRLPRAHLAFDTQLHPTRIAATHKEFTKSHPRYPLIKNKTVGIALIDLRRFKAPADYLATVKKKDLAAYQARRAIARGYRVDRNIRRNIFIDAIHEINNSAEFRQGRPMDAHYRVKQTTFEDHEHCAYFGVFDKTDQLVGYCNLAMLGDFAATERLLGYKTSDSFMYLLLMEIICSLIEQKTVNFLMYDTYLGARPGLRSFKHKLGFRPYLVHYSLA